MKDTDATGCGKCSLCCKIMGVNELRKERNTWCAHHAKNGVSGCCSRYETRPPSCQTYECLWLQSVSCKAPLPLELKPSNCGALLNPTKDGVKLVVEMNEGVDWRKGVLGEFIAKVSYSTLILVKQRSKIWGIRNNAVVLVSNDSSSSKAEILVEVDDRYV